MFCVWPYALSLIKKKSIVFFNVMHVAFKHSSYEKLRKANEKPYPTKTPKIKIIKIWKNCSHLSMHINTERAGGGR